MYNKKIVAFVPIKLNSQRLPRKNLLPLKGRPLCYHILNTLEQIELIDEVYVYCSDDKIIEYIPEGVQHLKRSVELDGDLVKGFDIYDSFINEIDADIYILAHTTSPFIEKETIENALSKIVEEGYDSAFSAQKIQTFAWFNNKPINYDLNDVPRTQDMDPLYIETSGFYMFKKEIFTENRRRIGFNPYTQEVSELEAIDIDTKEDYNFALKLVEGVEKNNE